MTVLQLQYILEVNRTRFITKAARNLFVAPSSVSTAIAALEAELGYPIFVRDRKGVQPTQQGLWVLTHASSICEHHRLILRGAAARLSVCIPQSTLSLPVRLTGWHGSAAKRLCSHTGKRCKKWLWTG